ncbi:MAG: hypothetical protein O3A47_03185 [Chloroflexi bacterium]|nr:hypothetical protein [Chloroflexota bacterium]
MKVATLSLRKWLPWVFATTPAVIALFLPGNDFRASGAMTLFAVVPASIFVLLLIKRPWRARTVVPRSLGTVGLLVLAVMSIGAAVAGTPSFLKEQFGLFISPDDYGPRVVIATPGGYVVVGDDAAENAVVWLSEDWNQWTRVPHLDVLANLEIADAAFTEFGIVMVGQDEVTKAAVALVSPDGTSWQRAASLDVDPQGSENFGKPTALAAQGRRLVLIGEVIGNDSVFWYSSDPSEWSVADPKPVHDYGKVPVEVIGIDEGFVAANNSHDSACRPSAIMGRI